MTLNLSYSWILLLFIIILMIIHLIRGWYNGLLLEIVMMVSTIVCVVLAYYGSNKAIDFYTFIKSDTFNLPLGNLNQQVADLANMTIWFLIIFLILQLLLFILENKLRFLNEIKIIGMINQIGGCILAALKGVVNVVIILLVISSPLFKNGSAFIADAHLDWVMKSVEVALPQTAKLIKDNQIIEKIQNAGNLTVDEIKQLYLEYGENQ